ncbi:TRAP transporter small permease subunit, partial [Amylibacter sp.]|nr:TRAP transporter small permease subunit [Amylibacter sp.]
MRDWQPILGLPLWFWLFIAPSLFALFCLYNRDIARQIITPVWRILDPIYKISGAIAASFMALILFLIVGQMVSRWSGLVFPGGTEFAGYAMACTSFFALAYTLNHGAHIRVSIFLNMNDFLRYWLDAFAMLISA